MTRVVLGVSDRLAAAWKDDLTLSGVGIALSLPPADVPTLAQDPGVLDGVEVLIMPAERALLTPPLRDACDRAGVRIVLIGEGDAADRLARRHGLASPLPPSVTAWTIADAILEPPSAGTRAVEVDADAGRRGAGPAPDTRAERSGGVVVAVWGPHGAPGRSTVAIQLAAMLAAPGRAVALVDADTHAPAIAPLLGLTDDGPGIAAACRRAEFGTLDEAELTRLSSPVSTGAGSIDVLVGINRPSRWPELSATRLRAALTACRGWADVTVVDVAASLDGDEELMSDLAAPQRNAAAFAALDSADRIVAVASAEPLGIARFVRGYAELRAVVGSAPVTVLINRMRPGPLGLDGRRQIRAALDRFSGIGDMRFLPFDPRAVDGALLHARPVSDVAPRSSFAAAMRPVAAALETPARPETDETWTRDAGTDSTRTLPMSRRDRIGGKDGVVGKGRADKDRADRDRPDPPGPGPLRRAIAGSWRGSSRGVRWPR